MGLALPVVWSDRHRLHDPGAEVWVGVRTPASELPERAERIRMALEAEGARFVEAAPQPDGAVTAVHDPELAAHLERAWSDWQEAGLDEDPGTDEVVPYLFPHPALFSGEQPRIAASTAARAGQFAYDTMTPVGPGTWQAARGALDAAVTAADLVLGGEPAAYACCRPPGHHVARGAFGGSCYLNNSAAAAARLRARGKGRVAVLDIDAHHGNGTQAIFWDDPDVLTGSVHVDPAAGWFPHFLGFEGEGWPDRANANRVLQPGAGDELWLECVLELVEWAWDNGVEALVVPLGVDAAESDSQAPLAVSEAGFRRAGGLLGGRLGVPTVFVQEGGYDLDTIGALVCATLTGFEEGRGG